jgi:hypothetical protein
MLERILNIKPGSDYKQSSRSDKNSRTSRYLSSYHTTSNDTVSLSPATAFLSGIHWQLKNFHSEKEKLFITFIYDGIEFTTAVMIGEISFIHNLDYDIKQYLELFANPALLEMNISSPVIYDKADKIDVKPKLIFLKEFSSSVVNLYSYENGISTSDYKIQKAFDNYENDLLREFDYINKCLISFLEKYLSLKMNTNSSPKIIERHLILKSMELKKK